MAFSIEFLDVPLDYPYDDETCPGAWGILTLGHYKEKFLSSLYLWNKQDYEQQGKSAIDTLLRGGQKAALFTEYVGPDAGLARWWLMDRVGGTVFFQEQILFFDQLPERFNPDHAFGYIKDRRTATEDGDRISEWSVPLSDLQAFPIP